MATDFLAKRLYTLFAQRAAAGNPPLGCLVPWEELAEPEKEDWRAVAREACPLPNEEWGEQFVSRLPEVR